MSIKTWQEHNYDMMVAVASKFLDNVLVENPKLLIKGTRLGGNKDRM